MVRSQLNILKLEYRLQRSGGRVEILENVDARVLDDIREAKKDLNSESSNDHSLNWVRTFSAESRRASSGVQSWFSRSALLAAAGEYRLQMGGGRIDDPIELVVGDGQLCIDVLARFGCRGAESERRQIAWTASRGGRNGAEPSSNSSRVPCSPRGTRSSPKKRATRNFPRCSTTTLSTLRLRRRDCG